MAKRGRLSGLGFNLHNFPRAIPDEDKREKKKIKLATIRIAQLDSNVDMPKARIELANHSEKWKPRGGRIYRL